MRERPGAAAVPRVQRLLPRPLVLVLLAALVPSPGSSLSPTGVTRGELAAYAEAAADATADALADAERDALADDEAARQPPRVRPPRARPPRLRRAEATAIERAMQFDSSAASSGDSPRFQHVGASLEAAAEASAGATAEATAEATARKTMKAACKVRATPCTHLPHAHAPAARTRTRTHAHTHTHTCARLRCWGGSAIGPPRPSRRT